MKGMGRWLALALAAAGAVGLAGCSGVVETSWSPDGKRIAYGTGGKLRVYEVATKQSKALAAEEAGVLAPSWSPDGKEIAFYSVTWGEKGAVALRVVNPETGKVRTLASEVWFVPREVEAAKIEAGQTSDEALHQAQQDAVAGLMYCAAVSWSPDGGRLVCTAASESAGRVLLINCKSGEVKTILEGPQAIVTAAWSPDGAQLAYVRGPTTPNEMLGEVAKDDKPTAEPKERATLWVYTVATEAESKVCELPKGDYALGTRLEWSGDSKEIGFVVSDPENEDRAIGCVVAAKPGAPVREEVRGLTQEAAWAPGLKGLAFVEPREKTGPVLIYRGVTPRTRRALGELPRATPGEEEVQSESSSDSSEHSLPTFSRDGRRIALRVGSEEAPQIAVFEVP